jgi:hypothetical protein
LNADLVRALGADQLVPPPLHLVRSRGRP